MKTLARLVLGIALVAHAGTALAAAKFPTIRTQIRRQAKAAGALKDLVGAKVQVQVKGDSAHAQIYSIAREWPSMERMLTLQKTATFKITTLPDGKLAEPVKGFDGQVWQQIMRMNATGAGKL